MAATRRRVAATPLADVRVCEHNRPAVVFRWRLRYCRLARAVDDETNGEGPPPSLCRVVLLPACAADGQSRNGRARCPGALWMRGLAGSREARVLCASAQPTIPEPCAGGGDRPRGTLVGWPSGGRAVDPACQGHVRSTTQLLRGTGRPSVTCGFAPSRRRCNGRVVEGPTQPLFTTLLCTSHFVAQVGAPTPRLWLAHDDGRRTVPLCSDRSRHSAHVRPAWWSSAISSRGEPGQAERRPRCAMPPTSHG